jgi:hypothetical protein
MRTFAEMRTLGRDYRNLKNVNVRTRASSDFVVPCFCSFSIVDSFANQVVDIANTSTLNLVLYQLLALRTLVVDVDKDHKLRIEEDTFIYHHCPK